MVKKRLLNRMVFLWIVINLSMRRYVIFGNIRNWPPSTCIMIAIRFNQPCFHIAGFLESLDDFYLMSSQLVMLQTTNQVFNKSLYKNVTPYSLLAWHRVRLANMMAHGGKEWGAIFSENNSGECSRSVMELFNFYF